MGRAGPACLPTAPRRHRVGYSWGWRGGGMVWPVRMLRPGLVETRRWCVHATTRTACRARDS